MEKEALTVGSPAVNAPYTPVVRAGELLFVSGQVALIDGKLVEGGFEAQCRRCLEQLKGLLEASGSSMDRVVKTTVFLADLNDFDRLNVIYREVFPTNRPSRSAIQVARLPLDAAVEIEAVAVIG